MDKTNKKISEDILQRTINCARDFSCLAVGKTPICKAKRSMGVSLLEITLKNFVDCSYRVSFGYTYFCTCPTRNEIYNRYNV